MLNADGTKEKGAGLKFERSVDMTWLLVDFACWECVGSQSLIDRANFKS